MRSKRLTTAAIGATLLLPAAGATAASANTTPQRDSGDRYELVTAKTAKTARAARSPKTGVAAANLVNRVAKRVGRKYDLDCRVYVTQLGAKGVIECKGSTRGKRELSRQIRRLIREHKIVPPEASGYYVNVWTPSSQKVVRIDWLRFGYLGTPV